MHPFDASLEVQLANRAAPEASIRFAAHTDSRYRNAIGPFGGWIAALLLRCVRAAPDARGSPLTLDAVFMGAIKEGALEVSVDCLRQNRSVGFWRAAAWQSNRICAHAQIALSTDRTSMLLQDARFPQVPAPEAVPVYANPRSPVPWLDQYIFRPVSGLLFSRAESMDSRVWIRDAEPRPLDAIALTALCDTPFPPTWIRSGAQGPVSTVSYSVYYRANQADYADAGSGFCLLDSRASLARNGYVDQFTSVWSESGTLIAQTQQMLWFADAPSGD